MEETMTPIEHARECACLAYAENTDQAGIRGGHYDHGVGVKAALTMHTARQAEIDELVDALRKAAKRFRLYEDQHRAKGTNSGDGRADANADIAATIEALIAKHGASK
jgi:hypothetical protein